MKDYYYLAHPFNSREYMRKYQLGWQKEYGVNFCNPFFSSLTDEKFKKGDESNDEYYRKIRDIDIVEPDIKAIKRKECKGILAIIDGQQSFGTIQEMVYSYMYCKPVYSLINSGHHNHPFLTYHSKRIFQRFSDFERFLKDGGLK